MKGQKALQVFFGCLLGMEAGPIERARSECCLERDISLAAFRSQPRTTSALVFIHHLSLTDGRGEESLGHSTPITDFFGSVR